MLESHFSGFKPSFSAFGAFLVARGAHSTRTVGSQRKADGFHHLISSLLF